MSRRIVLDANLLVLLIVGLTNENYIGIHKRLRAYGVDDFLLLKDVISASAGIVVTPNALSEASNLLRQINEPAKSLVSNAFKIFIERSTECYVRSDDVTARAEFVQLGLSDCAILEIAKDDILVLSADLDLCIAAEIASYPVTNFNHLRDDYYNGRI